MATTRWPSELVNTTEPKSTRERDDDEESLVRDRPPSPTSTTPKDGSKEKETMVMGSTELFKDGKIRLIPVCDLGHDLYIDVYCGLH